MDELYTDAPSGLDFNGVAKEINRAVLNEYDSLDGDKKGIKVLDTMAKNDMTNSRSKFQIFRCNCFLLRKG